jgi:hypothetical protein
VVTLEKTPFFFWLRGIDFPRGWRENKNAGASSRRKSGRAPVLSVCFAPFSLLLSAKMVAAVKD